MLRRVGEKRLPGSNIGMKLAKTSISKALKLKYGYGQKSDHVEIAVSFHLMGGEWKFHFTEDFGISKFIFLLLGMKPENVNILKEQILN